MFAHKDIFDPCWNNAKGEFSVEVLIHPIHNWVESVDCRDVLAARETVLRHPGIVCPVWYYPPHGGPAVPIKMAEVKDWWEPFEGGW